MRTVGVVGAVALVLASAASSRSSVAESAALVFGRSVGNIATASVRSLSKDETFGPPLWSPDGQMILFEPGGGADLTVISLADGSRQQLSGTDSSDAYAWAPRGRVIAYSDLSVQGIFLV